jgi:hypothetical protein
MNSIMAEVSEEALEDANVDLIIIGNGSDKMLNGYRSELTYQRKHLHVQKRC